MLKVKKFILGSVDEMKNKISWPLYSELQSSSVMVVGASFIFAITIGLMDLVLRNIVSWIYSTL